MSTEIEAAGSLAEAALVARAVENANDGSANQQVHGGNCLNCDTPLMGSHCHMCGQSVHIHRSFSAFWHDILHGVLHFDGKFWNTLPLLAWQPGKLTRRYIHGERAKFISPMAIFLFAIFMMFAVFSYVGSPDFSRASEDIATATGGSNDTEKMRDELAANIAKLEAQLAEAEPDSEQAKNLSSQLKIAKTTMNGINFATGNIISYPEIAEETSGPVIIGAENSVDTGTAWFDNWANNALQKANSNPDLLLYKLQSNGYKFAWLLIPISIPFIWLVTIGKRGHRFYDHAVFTTYSLAFMSMMFIICALAVKFNILPGLVIVFSTLYAPFHIYRQLRHAYKLSRFSAIVRLWVLLIFIIIASMIFLFALLALGLLSS